MLDVNLYNFMNESMAVDGIFFWCLILDSRPKPPARLASGLRALLVIAVEPLQMVLGAILSLSMTDYYPVYRICGRIWDIPGLSDQHYGGLIIWLPSTLTSFAGMIVVLATMRINEERAEREQRGFLAGSDRKPGRFIRRPCRAGEHLRRVVSRAAIRSTGRRLFHAGNNGAAVQLLKTVQSPACGMLMLHRSANVGGMESMMMVESMDVPAGGTIAFAPGGYHLMCTSPDRRDDAGRVCAGQAVIQRRKLR